MRSNPKNEKQAIEKLYRIRQYLYGYSVRDLTLDEIVGRNKAADMLSRIQRNYEWTDVRSVPFYQSVG